ncbi:hypothetical protein ACLI1A_13185 [Flavobacterium sp. RHBU_3]|uniref:hypothetical protein n=1 Tax=Flavobacterium sp. RHBU_3 TaxID=3391184 RepID=UPI003984AB58
MNPLENETRIVRPNYTLPAVVMAVLGYYIAFHIAEQPHMANALVIKALGLVNMVAFGIVAVAGIKKALSK